MSMTKCTACNFRLRPGDTIIHLDGRPYCELCAEIRRGPERRAVAPASGKAWGPASGYLASDGYNRGSVRRVIKARD